MFKVNFMANQAVEAADINAIGENIVDADYPVFTNGETYGVDALNGITAQMVTAGVKRGAGTNCAVSSNGAAVFIHSGTVFFDGGAVMTIDSDGISVELESSTETNYVYLFFDSASNVAGARCTTEQPSGIDCVLLAEISGSKITPNPDRFCKSRVLDAPNTPLVFYNSNAYEKASNATVMDYETISVPDLLQYTMARVSFLDYSWGGYNQYGAIKWYKISSAVAYIDLGNTLSSTHTDGNPYAAFVVAHGVNWPQTFMEHGDPAICLGLYMDSDNDYGAGGDLQIEFDTENNEVILTFGSGIKIPQNGIKIELFAGEVQ